MRLDTLERPAASAQGSSGSGEVDGAAMLDATLSQRRGDAELVRPSEQSGTQGEPF